MPHDMHTTPESVRSWPDRVGREGDDIALTPALDDAIHRQATLLMFGGFAPPERELSPAMD